MPKRKRKWTWPTCTCHVEGPPWCAIHHRTGRNRLLELSRRAVREGLLTLREREAWLKKNPLTGERAKYSWRITNARVAYENPRKARAAERKVENNERL